MESNNIINHQNWQGERHDSQNEGTQGEEQRPSNQTARRKRIISYKRPSRDYSKTKIKWSYELNKDLYNCYLESDHKTHGYMKRLKSKRKTRMADSVRNKNRSNKEAFIPN